MRTLTNESDPQERRIITKAIMAAILYAHNHPDDRRPDDVIHVWCAKKADALWEAVAKDDER